MPFGTIIIGTPYAATADVSTIPVPVPAGIVSGDALLLFATVRADVRVLTTPSGWTLRYTDVSSGSGPKLATYSRTADGTESGTVDVAIDAAAPCAGVILVIPGADTGSLIVDAAGTDDNTIDNDLILNGATADAAGQLLVATAAGFYSNTTLRTWGAPVGLTERVDTSSNVAGGTNVNFFVGTESLVASGATGTRSLTTSANTTSRVGRVLILREAAVVGGSGGALTPMRGIIGP